MTVPIETLSGDDATAFREAIKPHLMAILDGENFKSADYIDEALADAGEELDAKVASAAAEADRAENAAVSLTREYSIILENPDGIDPGGVNLATSIPAAGTVSRLYAEVLAGTGAAEVGLAVDGIPALAPAEAVEGTPLDVDPATAIFAGGTAAAVLGDVDATVTALFIKVEISL